MRVVGEAPLYREASDISRKYGYLPPNTLVTLRGERKNEFIAVDVELEEGAVEGWMKVDSLDMSDDQEDEGDDGSGVKEKSPRKKAKLSRRRMAVPKDEGLLIRRDPTFLYGLNVSSVYSILEDADANIYAGIGYSGGGHVGFYLAPNLPLVFQVTYSALAAVANEGGTVPEGELVEIGYVDTAAVLQYRLDDFELSFSAAYSVAVGVGAVPAKIQFGEVAELSTAWGGIGLGYRVGLSPLNDLAIRAKYAVSLLQGPVSIQTFALQIAIDFAG